MSTEGAFRVLAAMSPLELILFCVVVLGIAAGHFWALVRWGLAQLAGRDKDTAAQLGVLRGQLELLRGEFADHKLKVAEEYAPLASLAKAEREIAEALGSVNQRLDKVLLFLAGGRAEITK